MIGPPSLANMAVVNGSGGDMDSRKFGLRYTSNALDRWDICIVWMVDRDGGPVLSASNFAELAPDAWKMLKMLIDIRGYFGFA